MTESIAPVSRHRAEDLLRAARARTILVIGDAMLDRYLIGDADRISPEAPVPIVTVDSEEFVPGGAANVAVNVQAAGVPTWLIGTMGDDVEGTMLASQLAARGVAIDRLLTVAARPTTSKTRLVARGQQIVRIDREVTSPLPADVRDRLAATAHAAIAQADVLLIEDYDKGTIDGAAAADLIAAARARGIPTVVDPKQRNFFAYAGATVFKPNRRELELAFPTHHMASDDDLDDARQRLGADHLLVTLGAAGMALVTGNNPVQRAESVAREVFDVSGAGDTVAAWVAIGLAGGGTVAEAAWLANIAAGIEVGKRATASVSGAELLLAVD